MNRLAYSSFVLMFALLGCGMSDAGGGRMMDEELLDSYRAALPAESQLRATTPEASAAAKIGDPALFPASSREVVVGVNDAVSGIVDIMRALVDLQPSAYRSDTKEFLWGPYPNSDGFGTLAAYIKDAGEGEEFRYTYGLLRGRDDNLDEMVPIIWGAATPDPENKNYGVGVTLWDFEANRVFEEQNNPEFESVPLDKGRFVAAYGKGAGKEGETSLVVSAFRGFVSKESPSAPPVDLDYFYGRVNDGSNAIDFIDWDGAVNIDEDPGRVAPERVNVRMAFLNEGTGRAEVQARGGDLAPGEEARVIECWDSALAETYLSFTTSSSGSENPAGTGGELAKCGLFKATLSELGVPTIEDVDPALRAALDEAAKNGVPAP